VLIGIATILQKNLRPYDFFSRLGGDEFLVVAPETDEENRQKLFERLCRTIARTVHKTSAGDVSVTASIGVASAHATSSEDQLLNCADEAMYQAKRNGGNCVVFA